VLVHESSWKRLIAKIRENNVVPIVGSGLLVGADGATSLQGEVAARLLQACDGELEPPLPPFRELNEAVARLKSKVDPQDLYDSVHEAIRTTIASQEFRLPVALQQLAQIADFRLMVTLTADDLLARSLRQRCAVNEIVHSPNLPTSEGKDLPRDWQTLPNEVQLLYLFGKARSAPMFAIHDEDVLEYAHNMMARSSQVPGAFMGELQQRNLLLLGCSFPDWLSRFFLRATNRRRLSENSRRAWLIEPLEPEGSLTYFLSSYSKDTEILSDTPPVEFVAELYQRWMSQHGAAQGPNDRKAEESVPPGAMFFISYSRSTDAPRAQALYAELLKLGVAESEVWFDRSTLEPGQDFAMRILEGIRGCTYFLPLLSAAGNERQEGFVFKEWTEANQRVPGLNRDFILPVVVDEAYEPERYNARPVKAWQGIDFGYAPGGAPDERLAATLKKLVREVRKDL
jgi:hypothetical protein